MRRLGIPLIIPVLLAAGGAPDEDAPATASYTVDGQGQAVKLELSIAEAFVREAEEHELLRPREVQAGHVKRLAELANRYVT